MGCRRLKMGRKKDKTTSPARKISAEFLFRL
jgi:hypothetical protein